MSTSNLVSRGRQFVAAFLWIQLMLALGVILLAIAFGRFDKVVPRIFTLICELGLMYSLWTGSKWARWFYVAGMYLAAGLLLCVLAALPGVFPMTFTALFAAALAWLGSTLAFGRGVNVFLAYQRGEFDMPTVDAAGLDVAIDTESETGTERDAGELTGADARWCVECGTAVPATINWCPQCGSNYRTVEADGMV